MSDLLFADIILPFALEKNYTYAIPQTMYNAVKPGVRVEVQFRNKLYTGVVGKVHNQQPKGYAVKEILSLPDHLQIVNKTQLDFWQWMANYYMCAMGDVMNAALPAPYKLSSETILVLDNEKEIDSAKLNDKEYLIAEALTIKNELSLKDIQQILQQKSVQPVMKALIEKGIAFIKEELKETYKEKTQKVIRLNSIYVDDEEAAKALFLKLEKAPKQLALLMTYFQLTHDANSITKTRLLKKSEVSSSVLQTMVKNKVFIETEESVSRLVDKKVKTESFELTSVQQQTLLEIKQNFETKNVVLLHGVTGSGKTEIYIELIKEYIAQGEQVLYLLPEIALTAQIINRLKKHFGNDVGVYHSKFNQNERIEIWQRVLHGEFKIIVGARSALFLPFIKIGLVIVDEEHDQSYKQMDPAPRYHGRDSAIYLANLFGAKTLLGTATPAVESIYNAQQGKYGLVHLSERFAGMQLPEITIVDIKEQTKLAKMQSHFSQILLDAIQQALQNKEQVIIFRNRRGYSPFIMCQQCGWSPSCINCDVRLVYHKYEDELRCHYCGHRENTYTACPACGSTRLLIQGFGTEKIEDELQGIFPNNTIARLDLDTAKGKHSHERIIHDFEEGGIDILVGTQMVTKGLDFDHVNLVGILNADQLLNFTNFRAAERGFQMLMQVSGRAGRKNKKGKVIIQAIATNQPVLNRVIQNDVAGFYEKELDERRQFNYPPFTRLIRITIRHKEKELTYAAMEFLANNLRQKLGKRVLGPAIPPVGRIRNRYLIELLIKVENTPKALSATKQIVKSAYDIIYLHRTFKRVDIITDVDPL
ncbi:MAG: primosomal protein N' [Chitinophagales bacterium]